MMIYESNLKVKFYILINKTWLKIRRRTFNGMSINNYILFMKIHKYFHSLYAYQILFIVV